MNGPLRRCGETEERIFLAPYASNFVNGHFLHVDGGITASF
jgi:hypothetical protein